MGLEDLILSIITFTLILLFMFNPFFRKLMKSFQGDGDKQDRGEERMYESTDSRRVVMNLTDLSEPPEGKKIVIRDARFPDERGESRKEASIRKNRETRAGQCVGLRDRSSLKRAVIWKEIMGTPRALKPYGEDEFF